VDGELPEPKKGGHTMAENEQGQQTEEQRFIRVAHPHRAADVLMTMAIDQLLDPIWPEHRAVLTEAHLNDRTTAEAATALNIPFGAGKSRMHYALRNLRATLDDNALRSTGAA
jgi:RNA polymerase sigma-70 factor (ECF subfamily)